MKCQNCGNRFVKRWYGQSVCSFDCMVAIKNKPKKPIKPRTDKRMKEERLYHSLRESWLSRPENRMCAVKVDGCTHQATEIHHMKGREGILLIDQSKWLPVCRNCHTFITENSKWAIEKGYSMKRNA